jgi:hypothetical protein
VAAVYLGALKTLGLGTGPVTIISFWIAIVCGVRGCLGVRVAATVSLAAGALVVLGVCLNAIAFGVLPPIFVLLAMAIGGMLGGFIFGLVEFSIRAVNWIDKLMQGKGVDERKG